MLEYEIPGHRLWVTLDWESTWQDDQDQVESWELSVLPLLDDGTTADRVFHQEGYGDPPFDCEDEQSVTDWLADKGALGPAARETMLRKQRDAQLQLIATTTVALNTRKQHILEGLMSVQGKQPEAMIDEYLNDPQAGWAPKSALGKLRAALEGHYVCSSQLRNYSNQLARLDRELEQFIPDHVRSITSLLTS
jgi:hypothetical protein